MKADILGVFASRDDLASLPSETAEPTRKTSPGHKTESDDILTESGKQGVHFAKSTQMQDPTYGNLMDSNSFICT